MSNDDRWICGYIPKTDKVCVVRENDRELLNLYEIKHGFLCTTGCVYSDYPEYRNAVGAYWLKIFVELVVAHDVNAKVLFKRLYLIPAFRHALPFHMLEKPEQQELIQMEKSND